MFDSDGPVVLSCVDVSKLFVDGGGLRRVSFDLPAGVVLAILGSNGAGKSTLLNICLGFIQPDEGTVLLNGRLITPSSTVSRREISYVPEVTRLYGDFTALETLSFFDSLLGRRRSSSELEEALESVSFPLSCSTLPSSTYSKGMRQKVVIAAGLLKGASVFVLDEPASGLDPESADELCRIVRRLAESSKSVLIATHDVRAAATMADQVGILHDGLLIKVDSNPPDIA